MEYPRSALRSAGFSSFQPLLEMGFWSANDRGTRMSTSTETPTETIGEVKTHSIKTIKDLLHWDELPRWMQVDPYIRRGYRRQLHSCSASFWSLFYPHNELVNIWTHLLPACFYLIALLGVDWELFSRETEAQQVSWADNAMMQIYVVGTVICLFASVRGF